MGTKGSMGHNNAAKQQHPVCALLISRGSVLAAQEQDSPQAKHSPVPWEAGGVCRSHLPLADKALGDAMLGSAVWTHSSRRTG